MKKRDILNEYNKELGISREKKISKGYYTDLDAIMEETRDSIGEVPRYFRRNSRSVDQEVIRVVRDIESLLHRYRGLDNSRANREAIFREIESISAMHLRCQDILGEYTMYHGRNMSNTVENEYIYRPFREVRDAILLGIDGEDNDE